MRGVIEVLPAGGGTAPLPAAGAPLFQKLGLDIDAMRHDAHDLPAALPLAERGEALGRALPAQLADAGSRRALAPAEAHHLLREDPAYARLDDATLWDLVAWAWLRDMLPDRMANAAGLYARDCAACHGPEGRGDGPAGVNLPGMAKMDPAMPAGPADFTDAGQMLAASDALLQGKLLRGGMGTGMPEFGSLYTDEALWDVVTYLRTFTMQNTGGDDGEKR
jgi:hypothetical protein